MLVRCNDKCKINGGMTTCALDVENNVVICDLCGDELAGLSSYAKLSLKNSGKVLKKKKRKAFTFNCNTCSKMVEAKKEGGRVVGESCALGNCQINISKFMKEAIDEVDDAKKDKGGDWKVSKNL